MCKNVPSFECDRGPHKSARAEALFNTDIFETELCEAQARRLGVRYRDAGTPGAAFDPTAPLAAGLRGALPAAAELDSEAAMGLNGRLQGEDLEMAEGLRGLVRVFRFDRILELLQEAAKAAGR
jgi:hypothetical protein